MVINIVVKLVSSGGSFHEKNHQSIPKIPFSKKFRSLLVQFFLLPVSAVIQFFNCYMLLGLLAILFSFVSCGTNPEASGFFIGGIVEIILGYFIDWFFAPATAIPFYKSIYRRKMIEFDDEFIPGSYEGTVKRKIYDKDGQAIGSYDSKETIHTGEDSSDRKKVRWMGKIALPLRIVAWVCSIIALFTDKFFVQVNADKGLLNDPSL